MFKQLQIDEFLRSVEISKNDTYTFLLGAGCSISSDIQSAEDCIWDWKKSIYKSNHSSTEGWIENFKNPKVQTVIQNWLDNQGMFIEKGNPEEYSFYAEKCFPIDENRRQYFNKICVNKKPSIGYRIIPLFAKLGILDSVWTTNFDNLINDSCVYGGVTAIDITLDTVGRINKRAQNKSELPVVKLHGDFKYGDLKNTTKELREQDEAFRQKLIEYLTDKHLIILGYSGRDKSLLDALNEAYSKEGGGRIFWCGYGKSPNEDVRNFISNVNKNGRDGYYIPTEGFDSTLIGLSKLLFEDNSEFKKELDTLQKNEDKNEAFKPFDLKLPRVNKVLKSNCFEIEFPSELFVAESKAIEKPWRTIRELVEVHPEISAVPYHGNIWTFGTLSKIKEVLGEVIQGDILRKPLTEINIHNASLSSLFLSTLCKVFVSNANIKSDFRERLWSEADVLNILNVKIHRAIRLSLEKVNAKYFITLNPDFHIAQKDVSKELKQQIGLSFFHKIWNKQYNEYVTGWRNTLFTQDKYEFPSNSGTGFTFKISKAPIFTEICDLNNSYSNNHNVPLKYLQMRGIQFKEVSLLFSNNLGGRTETDTHPMRGLVNFKPFETSLNSFFDDSINLGVICPENQSTLLYNFLIRQHQEIQKHNPKDDYIIDFPGFQKIYGITLNIPDPASSSWMSFDEPNFKSLKESANELKKIICDKISQISTIGKQKVIIVFIPEKWMNFTSYNDNGESFDLHDYIKAFCAEKGVTSQFIREKTVLDQTQSCQINWWLSLSYYVKSFRTPWILNNSNKTTAFAGIGYSIDSKEESNEHIVLGCSHIYSSTGEGLKYKLSKISNERIQWRHKKPHLSYDDAYDFGRSVLNLFYESMNEVPKRVVIHKRTFFTEDEKAGILDSLFDSKKIEGIDLVEINFENDIRYVSSKIFNGKAEVDGFSVSRGTCIQLNSNQALLWAHGVVPSVKNPEYNFYPGGRYIPKPLKIIKHHGTGSIEEIAIEILGLTKMNWNSLNMYSQLPATIASSNEIARIGKLIENREKIEYDYRYFI